MNYATEENNYPKAIAISTGILVIFLAISFFIVIGSALPPEDIGTGGIIVNYGTSATGMGDDYTSIEEPSTDPNANNKLPDKVVPESTPTPVKSAQASDKTLVTQDNEDAPVVTSKTKKSETAPNTTKETKETKPTVNPNALYKGKKNNGQGAGDGTGNTPGNQGSKNGDPLAANYGEGGSGFGSTKLDLAGRKFLSLPKVSDDGQSRGIIAVEIRVDKHGVVVNARAGVKGTTLSDLSLWRKCEQAVIGARLNQLDSAPEVQIGVVKFNFRVN